MKLEPFAIFNDNTVERDTGHGAELPIFDFRLPIDGFRVSIADWMAFGILNLEF
jgi:hypothetical protein